MLVHFLATAGDTGGEFALIEARARQGMEPGPHIHSNEDESIYLLSGRIWFKVGQEEYEAGPGDLVFMPRGVQHQFRLLSESIHVLILITPGGFEDYFWQMMRPATSLKIPPLDAVPPSAEEIALVLGLNDAFGLRRGME
jgi:quercetin dioxygenase-like cupin family protein